jgi:molecular chaperone DnaK
MPKVLGIDFGTTNSCMAIWEKGEVIVIPNAEGVRVTPSVVAFTKIGEILVGEPAKRQAVTNPKNTVFFVKRLMGQEYLGIKDVLEKFPYDITAGNNSGINIIIDNKTYTPQQISALILKKLVNDAELYLGEKVKQAVITVPAYFNDNQRRATYDAGKIADLDVLAILNEPSSAALAYSLDKKRDEILGVYDFGGGTFDISILKICKNEFEVLSSKGDTRLGGIDFDNVIIDYLAQAFQKKYNVDLRNDPQALQRLTDAAETAKCELSSVQTTEINLPFISATDSGPMHMTEILTRRKLEDLISNLIEKTELPLDDALLGAQLACDDISEILLVGGMTRMPKITREVKNKFHCKVLQSIKPDEVVAYGAAIRGASLAGSLDDVMFLDVIPMSLGIETSEGICTKLLDRNTTIPTRVTEIFTTESDNQSTVTINVLQGESELATENKSIGHFALTGIKPASKGMPHIDVTFDIDANGILTVSAVDLGTGQAKDIQISSSSKLTEKEIKQMKKSIE